MAGGVPVDEAAAEGTTPGGAAAVPVLTGPGPGWAPACEGPGTTSRTSAVGTAVGLLTVVGPLVGAREGRVTGATPCASADGTGTTGGSFTSSGWFWCRMMRSVSGVKRKPPAWS